ncbi:translation initiation factor IF-2-like [Equus quagga]|uniref:translation initiation factor IF-2-like n=1 Tax=Equus quagga TaxID=89248 RepID=UPI001EE1BC30|nr:translation initiation factor IF-2-like [Equus quagga]
MERREPGTPRTGARWLPPAGPLGVCPAPGGRGSRPAALLGHRPRPAPPPQAARTAAAVRGGGGPGAHPPGRKRRLPARRALAKRLVTKPGRRRGRRAAALRSARFHTGPFRPQARVVAPKACQCRAERTPSAPARAWAGLAAVSMLPCTWAGDPFVRW